MLRAMCGVQLKDRERPTIFMFMLGLHEIIDQLAMANSVRWYGHVLRRENCHFLEGHKNSKLKAKEEREAERDMEKAG